MREPALTTSRGLQAQPADLHRAGLDPALDARARMLRQQARQRAVQPLAGQFRRNFEIDDLELCGHRGTRS